MRFRRRPAIASTVPARRPGKGRARRLDRVLNILTVVALILLIAVVALWRIPSKYQILMPASAQSVSPMISVQNHPPRSGGGDLLMTFVSEPDSNLLEEIFARFDPDATLTPLPPKYDAKQDQVINTQMMLSSEQTAELVALCQLGYKDLCSGGLQVGAIESYSKAAGVLKVGDVITAVNGHKTITDTELRAAITAAKAGDTLRLTVVRSGKTLSLSVKTILSPQTPHRTMLGISFSQAAPLAFPAKLPVDVKIDAGEIGGPSAGLMFTLGILNRLSKTDLTHGQRIAGTGQIDIGGAVGAIGGIKQKVIGAQWAKARYFFAPCDGGNYDDAKKAVGHQMTLVPVRTLSDALAFLNALDATGKPKAGFSYVRCPAS